MAVTVLPRSQLKLPFPRLTPSLPACLTRMTCHMRHILSFSIPLRQLRQYHLT